MAEREGTISAPDGRTLAYLERGDLDGPPILVHHGTPGSRLSRHYDDSVYDGLRVICYDRPGYGRSDRNGGRSVASAADDTAALADALGLERFPVMGVSGGGPHALACAALLPDRVTRAAILVGAAPSDDPEFDFLEGMTELNVKEFSAALRGEQALREDLRPYYEMLKDDPEQLVQVIEAAVPESDRERLARPEARAAMKASFVEAVVQEMDGWVDDGLAFARSWGFGLEQVSVPTRLWQGELDVFVPRTHGEYLARTIPGASFELLPGLGHMLLSHFPVAWAWLLDA
jgi:pimeloyl-ACP methyl ester carboxylesterase